MDIKLVETLQKTSFPLKESSTRELANVIKKTLPNMPPSLISAVAGWYAEDGMEAKELRQYSKGQLLYNLSELYDVVSRGKKRAELGRFLKVDQAASTKAAPKCPTCGSKNLAIVDKDGPVECARCGGYRIDRKGGNHSWVDGEI